MPRNLPAEARDAWRRTVRELEQMGLLTKADHDVLVRYCLAWARYVRTEAELAASTLLVPGTAGGMVRNPLVFVLAQTETQLDELGKQLNLTPVARLRSRIKHQRAPEVDPGTGQAPPTGLAKIEEYKRRLGHGDR